MSEPAASRPPIGRNLLADQPDSALDRLARLTAQVTGMPIALVSFVDDTSQWCRAAVGVERFSQPRGHAYCALVVDRRSLTVLHDLTPEQPLPEAPRTGPDPAAAPLPYRFYAGAPLILTDGQVLGTLCVLDTVPHPEFSASQGAGLQDLAALVVSELELRAAHQRTQDNETQIRLVLDAAPVVLFVLDAAGRFILSEGRGLASLGLQPGDAVGMSIFEAYRDQPLLLHDFRRALAGEAFTSVRTVGELVFDTCWTPQIQNGQISSVAGVSFDVTRLKGAELAAVQARLEAQTLLRLSQVVEQGATPAATLSAALLALRQTMPLSWLTLWRLEDGKWSPLATAGDVQPAVLEAQRSGLSESEAHAWGLSSQQAQFRRPEELPRLARLGVNGVASLPLRSDARPVLLCVYRTEADHPWLPQEQALLGAAARAVTASLDRRTQVKRLENAAHSDPLTGLGNRRALERDLREEELRASRHRTSFSVVSIDLDGLKAVNDRQGHAYGDALLQHFGASLGTAFRTEDRLYRLGGDEFAALMLHALPLDHPGVFQRVEAAVQSTQAAGFLEASASAGVASYPQEAADVQALLHLSDSRGRQVKAARKSGHQPAEAGSPAHILILEDYPAMHRLLSHTLQKAGYRVSVAETTSQAEVIMRCSSPDLLLADVDLLEGNDAGIQLVARLRQRGLRCPVMFISGQDQVEVKVAGLDAGGNDYLSKPFEVPELLARVRSLLRSAP